MKKNPCIYIMTNRRNGTLYTGVTSDLVRRVYQHKTSHYGGFTDKYNCKSLVYYELYEEMEHAITREKELKSGSRAKKLDLINCKNPSWKDLYESIL